MPQFHILCIRTYFQTEKYIEGDNFGPEGVVFCNLTHSNCYAIINQYFFVSIYYSLHVNNDV